MSYPRTVLIVHPDSEKRRSLRALVRGQEVVEAESRQQAVALLSATRPSSVVTHHEDFKKLVRDLERHAPGASRAVLVPAHNHGAREALVDVAALGYDFLTIDEAEAEAVKSFLDGRTSTRLPPTLPLTARFVAEGQRVTCAVSDVSNDGLGLVVGPDAPLELLVAGAKLVDAQVEGPHGIAMQARTWNVQTVVASLTGRGIHLGVSVDVPRHPETAKVSIDDEVKVRGLLRRAVARGTRFRASLATGAEPRAFARLSFSPDGKSIVLSGARSEGALTAGDLVLVSFELGGHQTEFLTVALESAGGGLGLARPRRVSWRSRRASLRVTLGDDEHAVITVHSPLHPTAGVKRLLDLHPSGAAFVYDAHHEAFPPGLLLDVMLRLRGREVRGQAVVQGSAAVEREGIEDLTLRRCGLRLFGLSDADRQFLLDALVTSLVPEVEDASTVPFADIWSLFVEHQVKFPDYPADDPKTLETLTTAHALVGDGRHGLAKSFVYRHKGALVGHASGLRVYSKTWLTQHLLVRSGYNRATHVSQTLVSLAFQYGEAVPDVEYVRVFWRASNRWPVRVFGGLSAKLTQPGVAVVSTFTPCRRPVSAPAFVSTLRADVASPGDQDLFLAHVRRTEDPLRLLADDLVKEELALETLGARYSRAGLARSRSFAVVNGAHGPRGWVIAERSTPGLFWAEWFNAYRLVLVAPSAPDAEEVSRALLAWAQVDAARRAQAVVEVLVPDALVLMMETLGFANLGKVYELTHHRSVAREVTLQVDAIIQRLSDREDRAGHSGDHQ